MLNRNFEAECPNQKWVTDISYIQTSQGTLYLSVIRDLFDGSIVSYRTSTLQNSKLVFDAVKAAMKQEKVTAELQLHSDQGLQYIKNHTIARLVMCLPILFDGFRAETND